MEHEQELTKAVNAMCETNPLTRGAVAAGVLVTEHALVIPLKRPVVVEGVALDDAGEVSILTLIDDWRMAHAYQAEQAWHAA